MKYQGDIMFDDLQAMTSLPPLILLMLVPSIVHVLYAIIWVFPEFWFPGFQPLSRVRLFGYLAYGKQIFFYCMLPWFLTLLNGEYRDINYAVRLFYVILEQETFEIVCGSILFFSGILLEIACFNAIGETAILYGCKFGAKVEWKENVFPYNTFSHPQHLGVILVTLSYVFFFSTKMWTVTIIWWNLYFLQTVVEVFLAQEEHEKLRKKE